MSTRKVRVDFTELEAEVVAICLNLAMAGELREVLSPADPHGRLGAQRAAAFERAWTKLQAARRDEREQRGRQI